MHLFEIGHAAWATAEKKGLHDRLASIPDREATLIRLGLVMTEVAEAMQVVKRQAVTLPALADLSEEMADTIIRLAELATHLGLNLDEAVEAKLTFNATRPPYFGTPEEVRGP